MDPTNLKVSTSILTMQLLHLITALFLSNREHHLEHIFLSTDGLLAKGLI